MAIRVRARRRVGRVDEERQVVVTGGLVEVGVGRVARTSSDESARGVIDLGVHEGVVDRGRIDPAKEAGRAREGVRERVDAGDLGPEVDALESLHLGVRAYDYVRVGVALGSRLVDARAVEAGAGRLAVRVDLEARHRVGAGTAGTDLDVAVVGGGRHRGCDHGCARLDLRLGRGAVAVVADL